MLSEIRVKFSRHRVKITLKGRSQNGGKSLGLWAVSVLGGELNSHSPRVLCGGGARWRWRWWHFSQDLFDLLDEVLRPDGLDHSHDGSGLLGGIEVLGHTGHRDYGRLGIVLENASDEAQPIHLGHPKIGDNEGDLVLLYICRPASPSPAKMGVCPACSMILPSASRIISSSSTISMLAMAYAGLRGYLHIR